MRPIFNSDGRYSWSCNIYPALPSSKARNHSLEGFVDFCGSRSPAPPHKAEGHVHGSSKGLMRDLECLPWFIYTWLLQRQTDTRRKSNQSVRGTPPANQPPRFDLNPLHWVCHSVPTLPVSIHIKEETTQLKFWCCVNINFNKKSFKNLLDIEKSLFILYIILNFHVIFSLFIWCE